MDEADMRTVSLVYRGRILEKAAILEKMIEYFCLKFLCKPNRERDAILFLFGDNRMSLDVKRQVFIAICNKYYKDWLSKFPDTKKDKSLNGELDYLIQERNKFAHLIVDNTPKGSELFNKSRTVTFSRFKDDVQSFLYGQKEMDDLDERYVKAAKYIQEGTKTLNLE